MKPLCIFIFIIISISCAKDGSKGADGAKGTDGTNGLTMVSSQIISTYSTDMCTQYTNEVCTFGGGQLIKYSDGTAFIASAFTFAYTNGTDSDTDQISFSAFIPPSQTTGGYARLSGFVARGTTGYKGLYLVYYRSGDIVKLIHDTNGNNSIDVSDETITTLTLSTF